MTFDGVADDGAAGEGDNVRPNVELAPAAGGSAQPTVTVAPVQVTEGAAGTSTAATFTVQLEAPATAPVQVPWQFSGGTATQDSDYTGSSGTVTVPVGATSGTFDVTVLGDATDEADETAEVTVNGPANTASSTLTIVDDDTTVVLPPPGPRPGPAPGPSRARARPGPRRQADGDRHLHGGQGGQQRPAHPDLQGEAVAGDHRAGVGAGVHGGRHREGGQGLRQDGQDAHLRARDHLAHLPGQGQR